MNTLPPEWDYLCPHDRCTALSGMRSVMNEEPDGLLVCPQCGAHQRRTDADEKATKRNAMSTTAGTTTIEEVEPIRPRQYTLEELDAMPQHTVVVGSDDTAYQKRGALGRWFSTDDTHKGSYPSKYMQRDLLTVMVPATQPAEPAPAEPAPAECPEWSPYDRDGTLLPEVIYAQHLARLRVSRAIDFLNSGGAKGEDATRDEWEPDACAVAQLRVWTEQDLAALAAAGLRAAPKPDTTTVNEVRMLRGLLLENADELRREGFTFAPKWTTRIAELLAAAYLDGSDSYGDMDSSRRPGRDEARIAELEAALHRLTERHQVLLGAAGDSAALIDAAENVRQQAEQTETLYPLDDAELRLRRIAAAVEQLDTEPERAGRCPTCESGDPEVIDDACEGNVNGFHCPYEAHEHSAPPWHAPTPERSEINDG